MFFEKKYLFGKRVEASILVYSYTANHFTQNARPECTVPVKVSLNLSLLAATSCLLITFANILDQDQDRENVNVSPDLDLNLLTP